MSADYGEALIYAKKIFSEYDKAQVKMNIFVAPLEEGIAALVDVFKNGNVSKAEAGGIKKLISKALNKLKKEAENSLLIKAVYSRALSSVALLNGKTSEAEKECQNAIDILEKSDYGTELLKTYAFACNNKLLNREDLMKKAEELIQKGSVAAQTLFKQI